MSTQEGKRMTLSVALQGLEPDRLWSPREVGDLIGRSKATIYADIAAGKLEAKKVGGHSRVIESEAVLRYLRDRIADVYPITAEVMPLEGNTEAIEVNQ